MKQKIKKGMYQPSFSVQQYVIHFWMAGRNPLNTLSRCFFSAGAGKQQSSKAAQCLQAALKGYLTAFVPHA